MFEYSKNRKSINLKNFRVIKKEPGNNVQCTEYYVRCFYTLKVNFKKKKTQLQKTKYSPTAHS